MQQPVAFAPLIGLLERFSNMRQADDASTRLQKLESAFRLLAPEFTEFLPYLAWMMSIPGAGHSEIDELEPEAIRKRIFGHLVEVLKLAGSIRPSLFWIEDLQWADHSTQEFCRHLEAQCPIPGLLVVATMRTGYAKGDAPDAWPDEKSAAGRIVRLDLGPLSSEESKEMIAARSARRRATRSSGRSSTGPGAIRCTSRSSCARAGPVPPRRPRHHRRGLRLRFRKVSSRSLRRSWTGSAATGRWRRWRPCSAAICRNRSRAR